MKLWWAKFAKDYLTFSQKERRGISIILFLCMAVFLISHYVPISEKQVDKGAFQKELAQLKISIDSSHNGYAYEPVDHADFNRPKSFDNTNHKESELFAFDPNTLDVTGWRRLGVRDRTISTIHHFIAKGYRFRQPQDIKKIYGLRPQDAERLIPYVHIRGKEIIEKTNNDRRAYTNFSSKKNAANNSIKIIDINTADTSAFISLPGIGSKLAARIVNFRQKLGGFTSVSQLGETYGIADSVFQKIKERMACPNPVVNKININTADAVVLKSHPYIRWNIANAIVNYRGQHGLYKSTEDLLKIDIITNELFNKIVPYLEL